MEERWQQIIAEWLKVPVLVREVTTVREWSESKVVRIAALVDGVEKAYYGKLARSSFDTEIALCRLASESPSFPAPPGISVEIEEETWLLLQEASGKQLARNQEPELYEQTFRALASFHEQESADQLQGLEQLTHQVDYLSGWVFSQLSDAVSRGIFIGVDLQLLQQVRVSIPLRWPGIRSVLARYPLTLVHGDCHSGNLFLGDDGQLCLIDWGSAMLGPGLYDIVGLVDVARRMRDPIGDVDYLLQLYWTNLSERSRAGYGDLHEALNVLRLCRSLLELGWFSSTGDDYGQRANRELQIIQEALSAIEF